MAPVRTVSLKKPETGAGGWETILNGACGRVESKAVSDPARLRGPGPPRGQRSRASVPGGARPVPPAPRTTPGLRPGRRPESEPQPRGGPGSLGNPLHSPAFPLCLRAGWPTSGSPRRDDSQDRGQGNSQRDPRGVLGVGDGPSTGGTGPAVRRGRPGHCPRCRGSLGCVLGQGHGNHLHVWRKKKKQQQKESYQCA